jgi:hypothetical protein
MDMLVAIFMRRSRPEFEMQQGGWVDLMMIEEQEGEEGITGERKADAVWRCSQVNKDRNVRRYLRELRKQLKIFPPA